MRDRAFQLTGPSVAVTFQDLVIQNGSPAVDDGPLYTVLSNCPEPDRAAPTAE